MTRCCAQRRRAYCCRLCAAAASSSTQLPEPDRTGPPPPPRTRARCALQQWRRLRGGFWHSAADGRLKEARRAGGGPQDGGALRAMRSLYYAASRCAVYLPPAPALLSLQVGRAQAALLAGLQEPLEVEPRQVKPPPWRRQRVAAWRSPLPAPAAMPFASAQRRRQWWHDECRLEPMASRRHQRVTTAAPPSPAACVAAEASTSMAKGRPRPTWLIATSAIAAYSCRASCPRHEAG